MDIKLNLLLKDYFDKTKELEQLNQKSKNKSDEVNPSRIEEIKKVNNDIAAELYYLEFDIGEINKRIINLEYNKALEINRISNETSDIINNMIDNNERRKVELKYDDELKSLKEKLNALVDKYEAKKRESELYFENKNKIISEKYDNIKDSSNKLDEINNCKKELLNIIKSKAIILKEELEKSNIQKDGMENVYERMVKSPRTLDDTCIDFLETHLENLKICFENETDTIQKNEYSKNISDIESIINKIKDNSEINDYDKRVIISQIGLLESYNKKILDYISTFKTADYVKIDTKKEANDENKKLPAKSENKSGELSLGYEAVEDGLKFNSEIDSLNFILNDILSELDKTDSIYLKNDDKDKASIKIGDLEEKISLDGLKLPSGEYVSSKDIDDAIDRYYKKNKGKTYYIKERRFILNRTHAYQITPSSINNLKDALKNRSAIKLIKKDNTMIKDIYLKEALMEYEGSSDEYEMENAKEKDVGTIESDKEGKYISKKQMSYYLSEIFERKGPIWLDKLKKRFSKKDDDEKVSEIIKKI